MTLCLAGWLRRRLVTRGLGAAGRPLRRSGVVHLPVVPDRGRRRCRRRPAGPGCARLENLERIRDPRRLAYWLPGHYCRGERLTLATAVAVVLGGRGRRAHGPAARRGRSGSISGVLAAEQYAGLVAGVPAASSDSAPAGAPSGARSSMRKTGRCPTAWSASQLQTPVGSLGPTRARCLAQLRKLLDSGGIWRVARRLMMGRNRTGREGGPATAGAYRGVTAGRRGEK